MKNSQNYVKQAKRRFQNNIVPCYKFNHALQETV